MRRISFNVFFITVFVLSTVPLVFAQGLSNAEIENIVKRSWQYVAMYNVNNKMAMDPANPSNTGGWNRTNVNTTLVDHTAQFIARPNNDTLYAGAMIDLTEEPVILLAPAFDSKYVSLMVTGYDHYVNIPMSTTQGDFSEPTRILFYTERSKGYKGEPIEGINKIEEVTGDYISAVFRVMPHSAEPERMKKNIEAMHQIKVVSLSEYRSGVKATKSFGLWNSPAGKSTDLEARENALIFPEYGRSDFDIFEHNLLEVMQFIFNHTSFDPDNQLDQQLLTVYKPLGVVPGRSFDPANVVKIDGAKFRHIAERIARENLTLANDDTFKEKNLNYLFLPKGKMTLERLLFQSIIGPIGVPAMEAVYPSISTRDGMPMNAKYDYTIRMNKEELPPSNAFWSFTLYDTENGFFIPNERKKYSVGENAGMKLDADGGITINISVKCPKGMPEENCLPLNRGDYGIDLILRIYAPNLERMKTWKVPTADKL